MMIPLLGAQAYTVTRRSAGAYSAAGTYVDGAITTFSIHASIQPMNERQLQRAPEGVRASKGVRVIAQVEPGVRTTDVLQRGDMITYGGVVYEVNLVDTFNTLMPLPHIEATAYASETGRALP